MDRVLSFFLIPIHLSDSLKVEVDSYSLHLIENPASARLCARVDGSFHIYLT